VGKVISKDGTAIAFDQSGSGPAVMLVGGAFQFRAFDQRTGQIAALLSKHFTVYHYDRRGRGDSSATPPYAVEREIEDLGALIKAAGGSAHVFGHSSGAVLALYAAAHGLAIPKLALYEAPFTNAGDRESTREMAYTKELTTLLAEGRRGDAAALAMTYFGTPADAIAGMRQSPAWPMFEAVAPTLAYDNAIMGDGIVPTTQFASIRVPTLVMDGGASPEFMHNAANAIASALPNAQRRTLAGQTHGVDPEVLVRVLDAFFSS
jgi:pimeloyl-ACP methyl ester carboxylesterase